MKSSNKTFYIHNNQDYEKIKDEFLKGPKTLWEDLSYEASSDDRFEWDWRRPGEIVKGPRFVKEEEPLRFDISILNSSELIHKDIIKHNLASLSSLSLNLRIFRFVVPDDNVEFSDENYRGIFHFRFWKYGKFYDVVIDDRLPTRNGKLVSVLCDKRTEVFWPFLLEKAYNKLFGAKESLGNITIPDLMVDLTGGISEKHTSLGHTKPLLADLDKIVSKALEKESFIIFGRHWHNNVTMELANSYCITKAMYVTTDKSEHILLLRVFKPFITENKEWHGEDSEEWQSILRANKDEIGEIRNYEFWMPFSEFNKHDWDLYIVHWKTHFMEIMWNREQKGLTWFSSLAEGKWIKGVSSGGSRREHLETSFYLNPQYSVSFNPTDDSCPDCTIIISVLQKTHKNDRVSMNFYIFDLKQKTEDRLDWDFFKHNNPIIDNISHYKEREVTRRFIIPPSEYCIVVASNKTHHEAHFLLRVFSEQNVTVSLLKEKVVQKDIDVRVSLKPTFTESESVQESNKRVSIFFEEVSGEDKVVGWKGLKKILDFAMDNEKPKSDNYVVRNSLVSYIFPSKSVFDTMEEKEFSKDLARSLLATADHDHSGKLTLQEFQGLWAQMRQWIQIYEMYSNDNGYLPKEKLKEALDSAGFQLNSDILCNLAIRYSSRDGLIPFDDFTMCTSKLRTVFDYYRYKDPEFTDQAAFTLEEWLQKSIYS